MENLNLDLSECMVKKQHFTHSEMVNVCSGESYWVENGSVDTLILSFLTMLLLLAFAMMMFLFISLIRDN